MAVEYVLRVEDLPEGERKIVRVGNRSIGLFHLNGKFYALHNYCPHMGAEICKGRIGGTTLESNVYEFVYGKENEVIRCPWHGWEFDMETGRSLFDEKVRVFRYDVIVDDGRIGIVLPDKTKRGESDNGAI